MTRRIHLHSKLPAAIFLSLFVTAFANAEWGLDVKLSTDGVAAMLNENMGQCVVAKEGSVHAVWTESKNKDQGIYYRRSTDRGANWETAIRLSPTPGTDAFPLLAQSGSTLHLVFRRNGDTPQSASYYKRSTDGGLTWGPDVLLGNTKWWPSVAAVGSHVYISLNTVFADDAKNSVVHFRRSTDGGATWEPQQQLSQAARRTLAHSEDPAIAATGNYVHLVWNDNREFVPDRGLAACYRRSSDRGATWEPEVLFSHSPENIYFPSIYTEGPHVDICYGDRQSGHFDIYYLHSADSGATWEAKQQITKTPDDEFYPAIVRDGSNVHLAWTGKEGVKHKHSANGGASWEPAIDLDGKGSFPFIAVAGDVLHLIFISKRDGTSAVYYKRNPLGNRSNPMR